MQILQEQMQKNQVQQNKMPGNRNRISASLLNGHGSGRKTDAGQKGFTLPELLLVVGILVILAAVSIPAIIQHRDNLRQTELDEKARAVFIAAQNKLSILKTTGAVLEETPGINESQIPSDYDASKGGVTPKNYILVNSSSESYFMSDTAYSASTLLDGSANYVIEYNPKTYSVYGAWYWEEKGSAFQKPSSYGYDASKINSAKDSSGKEYNDLRSNKASRMAVSVGYYGGTVSIQQTATSEFAFSVTILNEAELKLQITPNDPLAFNKAAFKIIIASKNGTKKYYMTADGATGKVTRDDNATVYSDSSHQSFLVTLDSLEAKKHFANQFPDITAGDDLSIQVTGSGSGTQGSTSEQVIYSPTTRIVETNSLFAGVLTHESRTVSGATVQLTVASIANGRHLQNLSPEISHVGFSGTSSNETAGNVKITNAKLTEDIDWKQYKFSDGSTYDFNDKCTSYKDSGSENEKRHFYPIGNSTGNLVTIDGNEKQIKNLYVSNYELSADDKYGYAGLAGYLKPVDVGGKSLTPELKNIVLINPDICPTKKNSSITAYSGSLAGYLDNATVKNCQSYLEADSAITDRTNQAAYLSALYEGGSYNSETLHSGVISDSEYAGGLIGTASGLTADNSFASIKVSASSAVESYAGGLIGWVTGTGNTVSLCYVGGHTEKGVYVSSKPNVTASECAGGFVGKAEGSTITKAFSTASVSYTGNGVCGSFIGSGDSATVGGITYAYGIGTAFIPSGAGEDTINIARYADIAVESGDSSKMLNAAATDSYDIFLLGASAEKQLPYPCRTWLSSFHGDWGELKADLVYYEQYEDSSYGVWTVNQDPLKGIVLNTLNDQKDVKSDGYAVLSKKAADVYTTKIDNNGNEVSLYNLASPVSVTASDNNTYYLHMLPWSVLHKTFSKFSRTPGLIIAPVESPNTNFYDRLSVTLNGMSYVAYYNPHFAKAIASDDDVKKLVLDSGDSSVNPKTAYIRTARHLYELGYAETIGTEDVSNKEYWNNNAWTYVQAHDIDYRTYQATTYLDKPVSMPQGIIGNYKYADNSGTGKNEFYGFASSYDGGNYKISNLTVSATSITTYYGEASLFGNLSENSVVKDFTLLNPVFTGKNLVQALVVTNYGIISNVNIINPVITATSGAAAGLVNANETTGQISGCNIYPQQNTGEFSDIYSGDTLTVSNYTNAAITGTRSASGLADSNSGTITNCAVSAAVTGGINTNGLVSIPSGSTSLASGFVRSMLKGTINFCYSNCYTSGVSASGFAGQVSADASIQNCYALRKVTATNNGIAYGFAASNDGNISSCYTAASVGFLTSGNSYSFTIGGVLQPSVDYSKTTAYNFCSNETTGCYYLNWGENPQHTGTGDSATAITYDKLTGQAIGSLTISATKEDSYPYERNLNIPEKGTYPFPIVTGMKQYGDWPVITETTEFKVKLAYFEIYKEAEKYTLGLYIKKPDETEASLNTLRDDKEVFSDGYCLLIGKGYSDQQKSQNTALGTLLSDGLENGGKAYVSWAKNGKQTGQDSTNSKDKTDALLKISDMKINQGADTVNPESLYYYDNAKAQKKFTVNAGGDDYSLSLSDDTYYFRMLPFNAVVNNINTDSSTYPYQPLTFHNGNGKNADEASFYFTPAFAKSTIYSGGQTPSEIKQFSIRTARQLATLSAMYNETYSKKLDNITYKQDRNINMAEYSYAYGDQMFADSNNQLRWYRTEIGDESATGKSIAFDDIYDGNSKTISGLGSGGSTEETSNLDYPLFSYAAGGTIQNLTIENSDFNGSGAKSALCGTAENETIKNITIKHVSVNADDSNVNAGLLVGTVQGDKTVISGCAVTKNNSGNSVMTGTAANMGGAIGEYSGTSASSVTDLAVDYLDMKTDTVSKIGGVIGSLDNVGILKISKAENITITAASAYIGGVIGYMDRSDQNITLPSVKKIIATDSSSAGAVGGAIGNWTGLANMSSLTVYDSTITGGNNVGGIIGLVSDGSVAQNLTSSGVLVSGTSASANVGGAIGELDGGLSNVEVKASTNVRGAGNLGGAVGKVLNSDKQRNGVRVSDTTLSGDSASTIGGAIGDILDCSSSSITGFSVEKGVEIQSDNGNGTNSGGFVGLMEKGTVTNSYSAASVLVNTISKSNMATNAGGFVGTLKGGTIEKCYASGEVKGSVYSNIGGFFGLIPNGASKPQIYDCYATGDVTLKKEAAGTESTAPVPSEGGFGGSVKTSSTDSAEIMRCYSLGLVTQPKVSVSIEKKEHEVVEFADVGGFIGQMKEIQRNTIVDNLLGIFKNAEITNRLKSTSQNGSVIKYLNTASTAKKDKSIDSSTLGFTDQKDMKSNGNGPITDNILGFGGYEDYTKSLIGATTDKNWDSVTTKNRFFAYKYYVLPLLKKTEYFTILRTEKPADVSGNNIALDGSGQINDGYLNSVYRYIQQDKMFSMWMMRYNYNSNKSKQSLMLYWIDSDFNGTGYMLGVQGVDVLKDTDLDNWSYDQVKTIKMTIIDHTLYRDFINDEYSDNFANLPKSTYQLFDTGKEGAVVPKSCAISDCFYLREDGNSGLDAYNSDFTEMQTKSVGILPWTVADFSTELKAEYLGNNTAKLSVMKGAAANTVIDYNGYPYPMIKAVGKGITDFQHTGSCPPPAYHPLLTP